MHGTRRTRRVLRTPTAAGFCKQEVWGPRGSPNARAPPFVTRSGAPSVPRHAALPVAPPLSKLSSRQVRLLAGGLLEVLLAQCDPLSWSLGVVPQRQPGDQPSLWFRVVPTVGAAVGAQRDHRRVGVDPQLLAPATYPPAVDLISSVALTFFAYLGFAVISFTGGDLRDPARNLPRAMYIALGITTALYVLISVGVFGTLTVEEVIANGDTALAQAAKLALEQGRLRHDGDCCAAGDLVLGQRQHLRRHRIHCEACGIGDVSPGLRPVRPGRRNTRLGDLGLRGAAARKLRRPDRYRLPW